MKSFSQIQERRSALAGKPDEETRSLRAALSSEAPVQRLFGTEILRHDADSVDLSRASENGLPLLVNHNDGSLPIGRIRNLSMDADNVLRGDLVFSEATEQARDAFELARDGTLSDVSIRYRINRYETSGERGQETYTATDWTPLEGSVVSVPADASVGIGRQMELEGIDMPDDKQAPPVPEQAPLALTSASRTAGIEEGARAENERIVGIQGIAASFPDNAAIQDLARQAIEKRHSVESFKDAALQAMCGQPAQPLSQPVQPAIQAGADEREKNQRGIVEALEYKMGALNDEERAEARKSEFFGMTTTELGRVFLERGGVSTRGLDGTGIAGVLLTRYIDPGAANATYGVSGYFPDLLENIGNKRLFQGFQEASVTYPLWTGSVSSADFKPGTMPGLSHYPDLTETAENDAIVEGRLDDKKEPFQVVTYASKYALTRQALVNDDLNGFGETARKMGIAANRTLDSQVYSFVETNGAMTEDGFNLFDDVNHNNAKTGSGEPDTDVVREAREVMGKQTDWNTLNPTVLGIVPQYMVVPIELEEPMLRISTLNADPIRERRDNVYRQMWEPVSTPRLASATQYYMFGQRGEHINVVYLNDQRSPMLARDEGWSVLAAHWRVVFDFDVMAADWRSAIRFNTT